LDEATGLMSAKGQEKFQFEIENNLGPIQPYHLREARKLLILQEQHVFEEPRKMFLRK
jgi:hypothetical protein